ncbi:MAG: DNRLRE domain-containing protein [Candidatus Acidiferrales bacterium]
MDARKQLTSTCRKPAWLLSGLALLMILALPAAAQERVILQKSGGNQTRANDAWIDQSSTSANHGSDTTLQIQSFINGTSQNQRALVMFDLSSIPRSGIKAATLSLFMSTAPTSGRAYIAERIIDLWTEGNASWNNRLAGTPWGTPGGGGDFSSTGSATLSTGTTNGTTLFWIVTPLVQKYFSQTPPLPNYGFIVRDANENSVTQFFSIFSSKENATQANRPSLTVDFVQQVTSLTASPGNGQVILGWNFPVVIGTLPVGGTGTNGVLILRQAGTPVDPTAIPTDGIVPGGVCPTLGSGGTAQVIFIGNTTSFTDNGSGGTGCAAPANGTTSYYRVFGRAVGAASATLWSSSGSASGSAENVPEIMATPGATASTQQAALWMVPTGASTLAASGIEPSTVAVVGSNSNLVQGVNPADGTDIFAPASTGGAISGRPPVLDASIDSLARSVTYVGNQDNFAYAVDAGTGEIVWLSNPNGLTTNSFVGGAATFLKAFASPSYTLTEDLVVLGTDDSGSTSLNQILGINGNTGASVWSVVGGTSSAATCGGVCNMDIVTSTPAIDFFNNAIWVTSHNGNAGAASPSNAPNLWKINPNTGTILATANLGGNIDSSPTLTEGGQFVFVGTNNGTLFAINRSTLATVASFTPGPADGPIKGFPVLLTRVSPFTIVFSTNGNVNAVTFDGTTFTSLWKTPIAAPSTAIAAPGLNTIYVGSSDGKIHELNSTTGVDGKQRIVDTAATVGDPALDLFLNRVIVGSTDGRVYAFTFPF